MVLNEFAQFKLRKEISLQAKALGFDLVGFTKPQLDAKHIEAYKQWLNEKRNGTMYYLNSTEHIEARTNMNKILPGAQTVIVVAMNYYRPQEELKRGYARVARYAPGRDYHKIIGAKLRKLRSIIEHLCKEVIPQEKVLMKSFVDVGPILERAYAQQAGIGFVGKNALLITKEFGSWVLLGEIITNIPLSIAEPEPATATKTPFSSCGSCNRCSQACPTGAIIAPGVVDARLCISYLTIEHKGKVPAHLAKIIKKTKRAFGCDICQEVCPHNSREKVTAHMEFTNPTIAGDALYLQNIKKINTDSLFHKKFAGSAVKRAKRTGLKRTARIIQPKV